MTWSLVLACRIFYDLLWMMQNLVGFRPSGPPLELKWKISHLKWHGWKGGRSEFFKSPKDLKFSQCTSQSYGIKLLDLRQSAKSTSLASVMSDPWRPHGLQPTRLLGPRDFPGKSTGVGCHRLLWCQSDKWKKIMFPVVSVCISLMREISILWCFQGIFISINCSHSLPTWEAPRK